jgi:hypothetical protein
MRISAETQQASSGTASMRKRPSTKEYDGPTINGKPILSIEQVQQWFKEAHCDASFDDAKFIAQALNHCALFAELWKNTPALKASRRNNPSYLRMTRISEALRTLQTDLPVLIDDTLKVFPDRQASGLKPVVALLDSVNLLVPGFEKYKRHGRGPEPERWHNIARNLRPRILDVFKSSGRHAGIGKPTSPAVTVKQSALTYLGVETSQQAIVDAMRGREQRSWRRGKNPEMPQTS